MVLTAAARPGAACLTVARSARCLGPRRGRRGAAAGQRHLSAQHRPGQQVRGGGRGLHRGDHPAVAQNGDLVGSLERLVEAVADEHDAPAGLSDQLAEDVEQGLGLGDGEHRGGLVEDHHLGLAAQALDDLHPLALPDGEVGHPGVGIDLEPVKLADALHLGHRAVAVHPAALAEGDVLPHRHRPDEAEVLVNHADAASGCGGRVGDGRRLAPHRDLPGVGGDHPGRDLHQGGLARPVLAQQAPDLAGLYGQVDPVAGGDPPVALGDRAQFQQRSRSPIQHRTGTSRSRGGDHRRHRPGTAVPDTEPAPAPAGTITDTDREPRPLTTPNRRRRRPGRSRSRAPRDQPAISEPISALTSISPPLMAARTSSRIDCSPAEASQIVAPTPVPDPTP